MSAKTQRSYCGTCRHAIKEHAIVYDGRKSVAVIGCRIDRWAERARCLAHERILPRVKCVDCGRGTVDYARTKRGGVCRSCFVPDYEPSYEPRRTSSIADMERHAVGTDINWSLLNQRMARAMKKMRIPRIDRFGSQRLKKDVD